MAERLDTQAERQREERLAEQIAAEERSPPSYRADAAQRTERLTEDLQDPLPDPFHEHYHEQPDDHRQDDDEEQLLDRARRDRLLVEREVQRGETEPDGHEQDGQLRDEQRHAGERAERDCLGDRDTLALEE